MATELEETARMGGSMRRTVTLTPQATPEFTLSKRSLYRIHSDPAPRLHAHCAARHPGPGRGAPGPFHQLHGTRRNLRAIPLTRADWPRIHLT